MEIEYSKKLSGKMIKELMQEAVFKHTHKLGYFSTLVKYVLDSRFRRAYNLKNWSITQMNNPRLKKIVKEQGWSKLKTDDAKIKAILRYWRIGGKGGLVYKSDLKTFKTNEYWATIEEILNNMTDDCEGFANIIYHSALLAGIPNYRMWIVAGDVAGGGHAYVVYRADNGLEYPIDGCYWSVESTLMITPYVMREEYFKGMCEWFRFNTDGMYKKR